MVQVCARVNRGNIAENDHLTQILLRWSCWIICLDFCRTALGTGPAREKERPKFEFGRPLQRRP